MITEQLLDTYVALSADHYLPRWLLYVHAEDTFIAWVEARDAAEDAYRSWCVERDPDSYAVYRAAADREDAAQASLAAAADMGAFPGMM